MSNDKSATEKISTYAENTAESAGNTLKNAKENVFGKAQEDKTLGDKASEKVDQAKQNAGDKMQDTGKDMKGPEENNSVFSNIKKLNCVILMFNSYVQKINLYLILEVAQPLYRFSFHPLAWIRQLARRTVLARRCFHCSCSCTECYG